MMRRLFDALLLPTVSYGSEVWGPFCSPTLPRDIKKMADVQIAFFRQLCRLKRSVTPAVIFRELSGNAMGASVVEPGHWLHASPAQHA